MSSLDQRMNQEIEAMIAKLEAIKALEGKYSLKVYGVETIAQDAKNYADFWNYKLEDWATD
jgi:hypothetical protein